MATRPLEGRNALITGAARRVGHEIALALAAEGANVIVHYRASADEAEDLCRQIRRLGVQAWAVAADFGQPAEYAGLIERAIRAAGSLHILVNNASVFTESTMDNLAFDELVRVLEVNTWAPFALTREFARLAQRGKVVNLLDTRANGYDFARVSYLLSKRMLGTLTTMSALRYAPDVAVNAVAPGLVLAPPGKGGDAYLDTLAQAVPLRRHGSPADVAQAIIFLLRSDFITGQVIHVDGGTHIDPPELIWGSPKSDG